MIRNIPIQGVLEKTKTHYRYMYFMAKYIKNMFWKWWGSPGQYTLHPNEKPIVARDRATIFIWVQSVLTRDIAQFLKHTFCNFAIE